MKSEYLLVLAAILVVPLARSFDRNLRLYRHTRALFLAIILVSALFWAWDLIAIARGHWSFNGSYILGIHLAGMPVEEWLFFPILAFVSIFTWESAQYLWRRRP